LVLGGGTHSVSGEEERGSQFGRRDSTLELYGIDIRYPGVGL
jgi:hypothetical protein